MSKIKSIKSIGIQHTHDLEVDHPNHQYYLANGLLTSNSHSIAYSHISVYTAWLKCHYPTQFMCGLLNGKKDDNKVQLYLDECAKMGIDVAPPSINLSRDRYKVVGDRKIISSLASIKGVGSKALDNILEKRPFKSLPDFFYRTYSRVVNKSVVQALARAGALDEFGHTRKDIHDNYKEYSKKAKLLAEKGKNYNNIEHISDEEWSRKELLMHEKAVLGKTISGTLHEVFSGFFQGRMTTELKRVEELPVSTKIRVEAIVNSKIKEFKIKNGRNVGKKFAKYLIEDVNGTTCELTMWHREYEEYKNKFKDGAPVKLICKVDEYMSKKSLNIVAVERVLA